MSEHLKGRGFTDEIIKKFDLKDNPAEGYVEIPYKDINLKPLYVRKNNYNNEDTALKKYETPSKETLPGKHSWFYGLWLLENKPNLIITEGEYNAISLHRLGKQVIAIAGEQLPFDEKMLRQIPCYIKNICLLFDKYEMAIKRASELEKYYGDNVNIFIASYSDSMDANDYLKEGKTDRLKEIIKNREPFYKGQVIKETKLEDVREIIIKYFPEYWLDTLCCIDVITSMVQEDFNNPIALIMVGKPSSGKSTILDLFIESSNKLTNYVYRCDNFTPRSWISHMASRSKKKLEEIHLLPRIENKTMITRDLSCLFSKNDDELEEDIGLATTVLDGRGLVTDSGAHGQLGYTGKDGHVYFSWLGATTPMTPKVWNIIGIKGNRFLFLNIKDRVESIKETINNLCDKKTYKIKIKESSEVLSNYINYFYFKSKQFSIKWDKEKDKENPIMYYIAMFASLAAVLRTVVYVYTDDKGNEKRTQFTGNLKEHPIRLTQQIYNVAISNAINHRRDYLDFQDLKVIKYIALSSVPYERMLALKTLLNSEQLTDKNLPQVDKGDLVKELSISDYKAKDIIKTFDLLNICDIEGPQEAEKDGKTYYYGEYSMTLKEEYRWLLDKEIKEA